MVPAHESGKIGGSQPFANRMLARWFWNWHYFMESIYLIFKIKYTMFCIILIVLMLILNMFWMNIVKEALHGLRSPICEHNARMIGLEGNHNL